LNKIFILNDHAVVKGGADAVALSQYKDFKKSGLNVTLCSVVDENLQENADDLIGYPIRPRNFLKNLFWIKAYRKVKKLSVMNDVGIFIIHSWTKQFSASIFYALRGKKVYIVSHDYFLVCPNGGLYNYNKKQKCNVRGGGAKCLSINCDKSSYWIKSYRWLRFWIQALGIKICNPQIIALNELQVSLFAHFAHVKLLKNKIDQDCRFPEINSSNRKYLTYIGRGDPEKGVSVLVDRDLVSSLPIMVIGPEKDSLDSRVSHVTYTGWLNENDMWEHIDQTLIGIFPSLWNEVDPLTPWKFFSRGIPVACSKENVFGQFLLNKIPELVYSDIKELNDLLSKIRDKVFYKDICLRVQGLYLSESKIRSDIWSRGFYEIIN
jgi:glycosyltransferase involved in cell wall biosynthesis